MKIFMLLTIFFIVNQHVYCMNNLPNLLGELEASLEQLSTKLEQPRFENALIGHELAKITIKAIHEPTGKLIEKSAVISTNDFDGAKFYRIHVLQQEPSACGFNALKNVLLLLRAITDSVHLPKYAQDLNDDIIAQSICPLWQKEYLKAMQAFDPNFTSKEIDATGLELLINGINNGSIKAPTGNKDLAQYLMVIKSGTKSLSGDERTQLAQLKEKFKSDNFFYGFILPSETHWYALVINKVQGNIEYLYAESISPNPTIDYFARRKPDLEVLKNLLGI